MTWKPDWELNRTHVHERHAHERHASNPPKIPGFRRKSPCEIRRDKLRKEKYLQEKKNKNQNCGNKGQTQTVSTTVQCDLDKRGVTTRSMANKMEDIERPRDAQSESACLLQSPETVHSDGQSAMSYDSPKPSIGSPVHQKSQWHVMLH